MRSEFLFKLRQFWQHRHSLGPHLHFSLRYGFNVNIDGIHLQSVTPTLPEPLSGHTSFGHYGVAAENGHEGFMPSQA
jgi:hypothetical protein